MGKEEQTKSQGSRMGKNNKVMKLKTTWKRSTEVKIFYPV